VGTRSLSTGADPGGEQLGRSPPKNYESNFFHHDFVQFVKQHSRYKAILPSIVLSQQCCDVCFISRVVHGTYSSVPFPSHSNLCLSHPMGRFPWDSHRNDIPMDKPVHLSCGSEPVMKLDCQILLKSPPQRYWLDPPLSLQEALARFVGADQQRSRYVD